MVEQILSDFLRLHVQTQQLFIFATKVVKTEIHSAVFNRLYLLIFFMTQVEILWLCLIIKTIALT